MMSRYRIEKFEVHKSTYDGDTAEIRIAGDIRVEDMKRIQDFIESIPDLTYDKHIPINVPSPMELAAAGNNYLIAARGNGKTVTFADWMARNLFEEYERRKPKKVIFNDPATIVFWRDGTKTVVKCQPGDIYDPEKGLAMCFAKKALSNKSNFNNEFKKWLPEV